MAELGVNARKEAQLAAKGEKARLRSVILPLAGSALALAIAALILLLCSASGAFRVEKYERAAKEPTFSGPDELGFDPAHFKELDEGCKLKLTVTSSSAYIYGTAPNESGMVTGQCEVLFNIRRSTGVLTKALCMIYNNAGECVGTHVLADHMPLNVSNGVYSLEGQLEFPAGDSGTVTRCTAVFYLEWEDSDGRRGNKLVNSGLIYGGFVLD